MFQAYHRECFKCGECSKHLDSVLVCEGPDKDIYCKGTLLNKMIHYFNHRYSYFIKFKLIKRTLWKRHAKETAPLYTIYFDGNIINKVN